MAKKQTKRKGRTMKLAAPPPPKDFLDMIAHAAVKFDTDSYILGGAYHCALALRGYPMELVTARRSPPLSGSVPA